MITWYPGFQWDADLIAERGDPATAINLTGMSLAAKVLSNTGKIMATGGVVTITAATAGKCSVLFPKTATGSATPGPATLAIVASDGTSKWTMPILIGPPESA